MNFSFTFCHMDSSDALESYTRRKIEHVTQRLLPQSHLMEVIFTGNHDQQSCRVNFVLKGQTFHLDEQGSYMYDCVDRVADKIQTILRKQKERKLRGHRTVAMKHLQQEQDLADAAEGDDQV